MLLKVSFVLLPLFCHAQIKINITAASSEYDSMVRYSGWDSKIVTDHEVDMFNISMSNLNRGFRVELGKVPDGIFLKDPTTYGNLFHKYKWPEVTRLLQIEKIDVEEIINKEEVVLKMNEVINNSTDDSKIQEISLFQKVEDTVHSVWSLNGMPDEDILYDLNINFYGGSLRFNRTWRNGSLRTKIVKVGKTIRGNLSVKPGQTIVEKLSATKTIFELKIHFIAKLSGNVIGNYENLYGKYHFWAPTINNIMKAANIPNEIRTHERVEIRCFTNPKLEIFDKNTGLAVSMRTKRR